MLSQFAQEEACLFPPGTLLMTKESLTREALPAVTDGGRTFRTIDVAPTFL